MTHPTGSVAIVVSSCDAFFDCWRPFAFFFRKFWRDCPFPAHLIVNELEFRSRFLHRLAVGPDRGWAANLQRALARVDASHVLYFQDDYFLNAPVRPDLLAADVACAMEENADAFCFRARGELEKNFQARNERFGVVPPESDGRTRLQVTLWRREALRGLLRAGENAWEMEARGSERTRGMHMLSYSTRENPPIPYLMSAIVRGLWTRDALALCRAHDLAIAPHFRGTFSENSLLRRLRRAQTRRRLPRELARARRGVLDLDPD